jgi:hypothetical protein
MIVGKLVAVAIVLTILVARMLWCVCESIFASRKG